MLVSVLLLLLAGGGVLVVSVIGNHPLWAWASVALSVLAAVLLVVDHLRRRRAKGRETRESGAPADDETVVFDAIPAGATPAGATPAEALSGSSAAGQPESDAYSAVAARPGTAAEAPVTSTMADGSVEYGLGDQDPGQEATDEEDLRLVSGLEAQVLVVDERPRYHLGHCGWLRGRSTIALPAREARELGFTPCARCLPDATLAYRYRGH